MPEELLLKANKIGAERIEIEYKDGIELVTACRGTFGVGIDQLTKTQRKAFFQEMTEMKKKRSVILDDKSYHLRFWKYESFGEWVYVIEFHEKQANK